MKLCRAEPGVDLLTQLAHEHVHGAIPSSLRRPQILQQLVSGDDAPLLERQRVEQAELRRRQMTPSPSTYACTLRGSITNSSISIGSPRLSS